MRWSTVSPWRMRGNASPLVSRSAFLGGETSCIALAKPSLRSHSSGWHRDANWPKSDSVILLLRDRNPCRRGFAISVDCYGKRRLGPRLEHGNVSRHLRNNGNVGRNFELGISDATLTRAIGSIGCP